VRLLMRSGAWLYSAHTSLDARPDGPAGWLPRALGLTGCAVLEPTDATDPAVGIGLVGDLPAPVPANEFLAALGQHVERRDWALSGPEPETVSRVAVCPGSGGSLFEAVSLAGADVYVTGDIKYHQGLDASCMVVDVGHFTLEETMTRLLAEHLARELSGDVEVRFLEGRDPFRPHAAAS
jgi:putative NIF3 family GTP cyclohydrolase 1 type 2